MHKREVIFDITRLATRFSRTTPNGIDRVDLGYAQHFLSEVRGGRGAILGGGVRAVDNRAARHIVDGIAEHWRESGKVEGDAVYQQLMSHLSGDRGGGDGHRDPESTVIRTFQSLGRLVQNGKIVGGHGLFPARNLVRTVPTGSIYLNVSQFPLWLDWYFRWLDRRPDVKAVFFIHDLLPIIYPEFFPAAEARRHEDRLDVLARRCTGVIVASDDTRSVLADYLRRRGHTVPPVCVLPLPVASVFHESSVSDRPQLRRNYFVAIGTIEPRKNQLLLLNIWRELAERFGPRTPTLLLIGARGWDNENIVDMLERCIAIQPYVHEICGLSTPALKRVMVGARAVLMPTLAEGYGLPVVEARAAGVPLIISDIPAVTAQAGHQSTVLDPLDGPGWRDAVIAHLASNNSQISPGNRLQDPAIPTWAWHIQHAEDFLYTL